ncbi:hypothetical protein [Amorphus orientalis]|uniref:Uncharacterized protein n=1 Tax=Amorphus orientalis TaxID=649198 RepID=A0AAE3VP62_9HYPH|nr:hypothetical protein [Amorphus orientalis]MDQ0315235.1 hypothetical protein [Amorphus orientalis]
MSTPWTIAATLLAGLFLGAQSGHAQHMDHAGHRTGATPAPAADRVLPSEPGDAAFAAIAEIVALFSAAPDTDWARVDIDALRTHLVDMNQLVLAANVTAEPIDGGLRMRVARAGRGGEAAGRMVPAHGPVLAAETGWSSQVDEDGDTIVWTVTGPTADDAMKIRALGFFGLMATGDHHRAHHIALARGGAPH